MYRVASGATPVMGETRMVAISVPWRTPSGESWMVQRLLSVMFAPLRAGLLVSTGPSMTAIVTPLPVYPFARAVSKW